uniref:Secretion protein HlyD n=1 Tax=mine drainage metagenome TaxID=410659 RepID=E6PYX1_9ZZZZ
MENKKQLLKAGTPIHVSITGRTMDKATLIPKEALQTAPDGSYFVMLVDAKNTAQKHSVDIGIVSENQAQVLSGLKANDMVISSGSYALDPGTPIKISAEKAGYDSADGEKQ